MTKPVRYSLVSFSLIVAGVIGVNLIYMTHPKKNHKNNIVPMFTSVVSDSGNDQELMGSSHNVFVAKVVKQLGTTNGGPGVETQFAVEIVYNIKGNLNGVITLNQQGGYQGDTLYVMEGGDMMLPGKDKEYLLQPGSTYLLATRCLLLKERGCTLDGHPNARKLISKDQTLSIAQLRTLAEKDEKVIRFFEAYTKEKPFIGDDDSHALNSFRSLPLVEQERIKAEVEHTKAGMEGN